MDPELIKGTLSLLILSLLNRRPMYGYEIVSTVRQETDSAFEWKAGSLYPSLHKLEKTGLLSSEWKGDTGQRQRKYYQLTDVGEKVLAEKQKEWAKVTWAVNSILENSNEQD
jgi:transcriptional regulator